MTDYLWDETVLATVYLVSELDLHILEGDTSVMGGERVTEVVKVTHGDAGREFQLVCESEDRNLIERIIPTAAFMQTGTVEGKRCASVVRETSVKAISTVIID
jgi:hypothetical protein